MNTLAAPARDPRQLAAVARRPAAPARCGRGVAAADPAGRIHRALDAAATALGGVELGAGEFSARSCSRPTATRRLRRPRSGSTSAARTHAAIPRSRSARTSARRAPARGSSWQRSSSGCSSAPRPTAGRRATSLRAVAFRRPGTLELAGRRDPRRRRSVAGGAARGHPYPATVSLRLDVPREQALERAAEIVAAGLGELRPGARDRAADRRPAQGAARGGAAGRPDGRARGARGRAPRCSTSRSPRPGPRYFAFVGSSGLEIGVIGDLLASCFDVEPRGLGGGRDRGRGPGHALGGGVRRLPGQRRGRSRAAARSPT